MRNAEKLLERFVDMYGEVSVTYAMAENDPTLWYDYYHYSGQHMVLTDEGWEPGECLESYMEGLDKAEDIIDVIHAEVNWAKGNKKYPRIFPRKLREQWAKRRSASCGMRGED